MAGGSTELGQLFVYPEALKAAVKVHFWSQFQELTLL